MKQYRDLEGPTSREALLELFPEEEVARALWSFIMCGLADYDQLDVFMRMVDQRIAQRKRNEEILADYPDLDGPSLKALEELGLHNSIARTLAVFLSYKKAHYGYLEQLLDSADRRIAQDKLSDRRSAQERISGNK